MNVLVVGLGRWGRQHVRVLRDLGAIVWVAERDAERRAWAVGQGVAPARAVDDYRAALSRVDAVDVVTSAESHRAIAEAALRAGRPCFVEKPLALTATEGRRLQALAATGPLLQVGHVFRFHPVTAALRRALAAGRVGGVRFATARFSGFKRPRTDVGVTQTDALHFFDLFAYLLDARAVRVAAHQRDYLGRGLDDWSVTVVTYGDVPVVVEADYFTPEPARRCGIVGERGSLLADFAAGALTLFRGEHRRRGTGWEAVDAGKAPLPVGAGEPLALELAAFLAACAGGGPSPVPAAAGVHALEVVEAAARAAALARTVTVADPAAGV